VYTENNSLRDPMSFREKIRKWEMKKKREKCERNSRKDK
jgi:hypothetical protein